MGIKSRLKKLAKKAFNYSPLGLTYNYQVKPAIKQLRKWLLPSLAIPDAGSGAAQDVRFDGRVNMPARNSPQNEHFGEGRRWFEHKSQPYYDFHLNNQRAYQLFFLSRGVAEVTDLRIDQTPFSAFPNAVYEVYGPGEPVTLEGFHCNVYTNTQVSDIELVSGALYRTTFFNDNVEFHTDGRIDQLNGQFNNARIGSTLTVSGTGTHDGDYTVVDVAADGDWIDVTPFFLTNTTESATFIFDRYDPAANALKIEDLDIIVTTTPRRIDSGVPDTFINFREGDMVGLQGAGDNDSQNFTVSSIAGDGSYLSVSPTPAEAGSFNANVLLLRRWQGPYPVCPPGQTVDKIAIDFIFPQGLGILDGDKTNEKTVSASVLVQEIDDYNIPLGDSVEHIFDITAANKDPVRVTREVVLGSPGPARAQVLVARASFKSDEPEVLDSMNWGGARGFIHEPPGETHNVFEGCTVMAVILTASGTLGAQGENTFNGLLSRKLPTWSGGVWSDPVLTRSPAWAHAYMLKECGVPDSQIDLEAHEEAAAEWEANGWHFDYDFDGETNLMEARRTIMRVVRSTPIRDQVTGKYGFRRDETRPIRQAFSDSNSSLSGAYRITKRDSSAPTGLVMEYVDPLTWTPMEVSIGDINDKPARTTLLGCTSRQHAWEILNYEWAVDLYRNRTISIDAEMEPVLLSYDDPVLVQSAEQLWGQDAEVISVAGSTLTVWPAFDWTGYDHYVRLRGPDGVPGAEIAVTRGSADNEVILGSAADVEIITAGDEERTRVIFGSSHGEPVVLLAQSIQWSLGSNDGQNGSIEGVLDDDRVYADPGPAPEPFASP